MQMPDPHFQPKNKERSAMVRGPTHSTTHAHTRTRPHGRTHANVSPMAHNGLDRGPLRTTSPTEPRFPFVAIPELDAVDGPNGAQRVRQFIKQLGRQYRIKIEWMEASSAERGPSKAVDLPSRESGRREDRGDGAASTLARGRPAGGANNCPKVLWRGSGRARGNGPVINVNPVSRFWRLPD
jgi:hypothetical protein